MVRCPISPAVPWAPRNRRPSTIRPAPTPEDTFTKTMLAWPRPAPRRCSARAPRLASLSTWVGRPNRSSAASLRVDAHPAGQDRGRHHGAVLRERRGQAQADVDDGGAGRGVALEEPVDQRRGQVESLAVRVVGGERLAVHVEHLAAEVAERDPHVPVAEVDADHQAGVAGDAHGGATAPAAHGGLDQSGRGQVAHDVGHRRRGQPGGAGDVGLGDRRVRRPAGAEPPRGAGWPPAATPASRVNRGSRRRARAPGRQCAWQGSGQAWRNCTGYQRLVVKT